MNMVGAKTFRRTSFLLAVLLLFVPALASAALTAPAVQEASNAFDPNNPNLGTVNVAFPNAQTAGNLNVVVVGWSDTSSTVAAVTDSNGNTYRLAAGTNASACCSQAIYFAANIKAGANTVKVDFNQVAGAPDVRIREYSGLDTTQPLDTSAGAPGVSGAATTADSGSATTNNANDLIVGAGTISSFFKLPGGAGFGNVTITPHFSDIIEDKSVSAVGSYNATANTGSAGNWAMQMVAFSSASVASLLPTVTAVTPNSGADVGGDAVVITGTNFQPAAAVLFDATCTVSGCNGASAVNCTVKSSTEIDCSTPAHGVALNVTVAVQNVDGQNGSLANAFTYTKSTPVVTGVTPGQGVTNGGTPVTISGTGFFGPATVTIGGLPATNVTVENSTTIKATTPANAVGAVNVTVTNGDGGGSAPLAGGFTYALGTGPVNFIQSKALGSGAASQSTASVTLDNPQTAGDLTVVVVGWSNAGDVSSVTDDAGNTYTRALNTSTNVGGNLSQTIYYAKNITSSSTVKVTFTQAVGAPDVRVMEYRGLDPTNPLDASPAAAASTTSVSNGKVATGGSVTTSFTNNLIVAGAMVGQTVVGAGNNFLATAISSDGNGAAHQLNPTGISGAFATFDITPSSAWIVQEVTFHASASAPQPNFTLGASPSTASVNPGSSATYTVSLTAQNGFNAAVNLTCSGPSGVGIACSLNPKSATPGTPSTLTVSTTGPTAALAAPARNRSLLPLYAIWLPLPGMALAGIGYASRKRKLAIGMTLFLALGLALLLAGCGGGGSSSGGGGGGGGGGGTAAGTYTITVTGTSGSLSHKTQVTLTVQ